MALTGSRLTWKQCISAILLAVYLISLPSSAYAAGGNLGCAGGSVAGGSLFDTTNAGFCSNEGQYLEHLFSNIICVYVRIIDGVLDKIYCGVQAGIMGSLRAALLLYIAVFGLQILTGMTQLTGGEMVQRAVKITFIWAFATDSTYGIGIGFNFFIGVMSDGIKWVINAVGIPGAGAMGAYNYIDHLIHQAIIGPFTAANSKVVGFFLTMTISFFPIFLMGVSFLWETAMLLVSCVVVFLLSISAVAFLIALSPIFLSFMLFQATFYLFENWLRYMMSYTLQVIVVFAIVAMWVQVIMQFIGFFNDLSKMIGPYQQTLQPGNTYQPTDQWAICPGNYGMNAFGPTAQCQGGYNNDNDFLANASDVIPPSRIMEIKEFIFYVIFHMASLILIAYSFRILLKNSSQIARDLVGPAYVPMLGQGFGMSALGDPSGYPNKMEMRSSSGVGKR